MAEDRQSLDYAAQLAAIERSIAETRKFGEEQHKLNAEASKLAAEQNKLTAEALKFQRERSLAPLLVISSVLSAALSAALTALLTHYWR